MLEPSYPRVRPTPMKTIALIAAAVLVLGGCGSAEEGADQGAEQGAEQGSAEEKSKKVGACPVDAPAVTNAKQVATVDLDGDGTPEQVRATAAGGECGNTLFAELGEGYVATALPDLDPPVSSAFAVDLPGREGQLLVTRADHPRGGHQLRVYAADGEALTELAVDGNPLVPFVATDVQEHPFSIDCGEGGLVFTEAVAHEPPGIVAAWDIRQTTYAVDGTTVTPGATEEIADNVLPEQLRPKYPELVKHAAFASCRA